MKMNQKLIDVWADINNINNWDNPDFDWKKAYVSSVFAKLAYLRKPQYELKNAKRANLIPCEEHSESVVGNSSVEFEQILRNSDMHEFFVVMREFMVAVIVKIRDEIFISLRGTQQFYDWFVNLNVSMSCPYADFDLCFHKGFHYAIASGMDEIRSEILTRFGNAKTIYVTGHSLGGGLAAILHALWSQDNTHYRHHSRSSVDESLVTHSCYTFGMPRYGNHQAIEQLPNPFHVYNKSDFVPTTPPKFIGFENSRIEYCLTPEGRIDSTSVKGSDPPNIRDRLASTICRKEHKVETYIRRIQKVRDTI